MVNFLVIFIICHFKDVSDEIYNLFFLLIHLTQFEYDFTSKESLGEFMISLYNALLR